MFSLLNCSSIFDYLVGCDGLSARGIRDVTGEGERNDSEREKTRRQKKGCYSWCPFPSEESEERAENRGVPSDSVA